MPSGNAGNTTASSFRAKVMQMKSWKPGSNPSNRDRLELYALHKQAVSGDAPLKDPPPTSGNGSTTSSQPSPAEKAKLAAWRNKRGLTQNQAMTSYITEADRQLRIYGTAPGTPTNTPADVGEDGSTTSVLLTPRGLAAIPLLCAAAAETRTSYLSRLSCTGSPSNGWWRKQEPLCGEPGSYMATPEAMVIAIATKVEDLSLRLTSDASSRDFLEGVGLRPSVLQSFLWPLHNVSLVVWMLVIFISTLVGSSLVVFKTIMMGSKRTGVKLEDVFAEEIGPCKKGAEALCERQQAVSVRLLGLFIYPLGVICEVAENARDKAPVGRNGGGLMVGGGVYVIAIWMTWWYWFCMLPWFAVFGLSSAVCIGWSFSLIELAGI